jgi:serine/threonine protein kinase
MPDLVKPLSTGQRLLEYVIQSVLGQGGFGTTYLCHDEHLGRRAVIKEFTPAGVAKRTPDGKLGPVGSRTTSLFAKGRSEFLEEARKLALFRHPNIVRVNRYFEANNTGYFVMDHEAGGSLRDIISNVRGPLSEQEIEGIIAPLCQGLAELHQVGLLHRDVKPDNIIVRSDGDPALIDFGAAVQFGGATKGPIPFVGTVAYAPIEQLDPNGNIGPWTDIYSMGAVMYEMVTGHPPTPARSRMAGFGMTSAAEGGRGKYSDRLLGMIDKCLSLEANERPQSIRESFVLLRADQDERFRLLVNDIALKMAAHFCNWAKPNEGLRTEELVAFMAVFPAIDLSWRIGKGLPGKDTAERLLNTTSLKGVRFCSDVLKERGFGAVDRPVSPSFVFGRMDEYAATYLLDRRQKEWHYELTLKQLAENCIAPTHGQDIPGFAGLMEDVVDRARGRVKKEFRKIYRKVVYRAVEGGGWVKETVDLAQLDQDV